MSATRRCGFVVAFVCFALLLPALPHCGGGEGGGEAAPNLCAGVSCGDHGACAQGADGPVCVCAPGYASSAAAPCSAVPGVCDGADCGPHGGCVDAAGVPACLCEPGYEPAPEGGCVVTSPLPDLCEGVDCAGHGVCAVAAGAPLCVCESGYVREGPTACVPIPAPADLCAEVDCSGHGVCVVAGGSATCVCDAGYEREGETGCAPVAAPPDLCAAVDCAGHGVCATVGAAALCVCDPGYVPEGATCVPGDDPCEGVTCSDHGACAVAGDGSPLCVCEAGYDTSGADCVPRTTDGPTPCQAVDCSGSGVCVVAGDGSPLCVCDPGYHRDGTACLRTVDPCAGEDCDGHGACVVTIAGPLCVCEPGYVAEGAACTPVTTGDPCDGVTCGGFGACVAGAEGPVCVCEPGFRAEGTACVAIEDPCLGVTCAGFGGCVVTAGGAPRCLCDGGYVAVGLACQPAPETAVPETVLSDPSTAETHPEAGTPFVPNELLVFAVEGHDAGALVALMTTRGAAVAAYEPQSRRYIVRFSVDTPFDTFAAARAAIAASPEVAAVSEQWVYADALVPSGDPWGSAWNEADPGGTNWYLEAIRAPTAWDTTTGGRIKVGVIDMDFTEHEDLGGRLRDQSLLPADQRAALRDNEHGTMTAGLLAAGGSNGSGLTGVLWTADLYFCQTNTLLSGVFDCLRWLADRDVRVINFSGGRPFRGGRHSGPWDAGVAPWDNPIQDWAANAREWQQALEGILRDRDGSERQWVFVQSAGNEALTQVRYAAPVAQLPEPLRSRILVVGAVGTDLDELACYSNSGGLDIVAPGGDMDCVWGGLGGDPILALSGADGTRSDSGTSLSAPLVAGAVALTWSLMPGWTAEEAVAAVLDSAAAGPGGLPSLDLAGAVAEAVAACTAAGGALIETSPIARACTTECVPDCAGKECLADDGCGGQCVGLAVRTCEGNVLHYCEADGPGTVDCTAVGRQCQPDPAAGGVLRCVFVEADDAPPTGRIVSPTNLVALRSAFEVTVEVADDTQIEHVTVSIADARGVVAAQFHYPGTATASWTTEPFDTTGWESGYRWITLLASDGVNPTRELDRVTVDYQPTCEPDCGEMVPIPVSGAATTFVMGSPEGVTWWYSDERPAHEVTLSPFSIDRYEVTVADYRACVDALACTAPSTGGSCNWDVEGRDDHPVNCVTWYQANTYCQWRGKRLPTEAEWERAAKGESGRRFPWGDSCPASWGSDCTAGEWGPATARANCAESYCYDGYPDTAPVGSFPRGASPDGVMDLAGNVWEWVWDWYGTYPAEAQTDPQGPGSGSYRVLRGGYWGSSAADLRAAYRGYGSPGDASDALGFRCAR